MWHKLNYNSHKVYILLVDTTTSKTLFAFQWQILHLILAFSYTFVEKIIKVIYYLKLDTGDQNVSIYPKKR